MVIFFLLMDLLTNVRVLESEGLMSFGKCSIPIPPNFSQKFEPFYILRF